MQRGHPFGMPVSQRQAGIDQQAVAVLHQPMPDEAQLRLLAFTLAVEPSVRRDRGLGNITAYRSYPKLLCHFLAFRDFVTMAECNRRTDNRR